MRRKAGCIFMVIGILLVISALFLSLYNILENKRAEKNAADILHKIYNMTPESSKLYLDEEFGNEESKIVEIDGDGYMGYMEAPSVGMKLPIMSEYNYEKLDVAPCRYSGSISGKDLVIAGHNYKSHFGPIKNLEVGDKVYFTDVSGRIIAYEVDATEVLEPTSVEEMTNAEWPLTLFTCTYSGQTRLAVHCKRDR